MKKIVISGAVGYLLGVSTPIVLTAITLKKYPNLGNILQDTMLTLMGFNPYVTRKAREKELSKYRALYPCYYLNYSKLYDKKERKNGRKTEE